eukprot:Pgem_evm1s3541
MGHFVAIPLQRFCIQYLKIPAFSSLRFHPALSPLRFGKLPFIVIYSSVSKYGNLIAFYFEVHFLFFVVPSKLIVGVFYYKHI